MRRCWLFSVGWGGLQLIPLGLSSDWRRWIFSGPVINRKHNHNFLCILLSLLTALFFFVIVLYVLSGWLVSLLVGWLSGWSPLCRTCHGRSCFCPGPNPKSARCYQSATGSIIMMTMTMMTMTMMSMTMMSMIVAVTVITMVMSILDIQQSEEGRPWLRHQQQRGSLAEQIKLALIFK